MAIALLPNMRQLLLIGLFIGGCATSHMSPKAVATASATPPSVVAISIALVVHDPTDLEARLATRLRLSLAARGIEARIVAQRSAVRDGLVVEVIVLNRGRDVSSVQSHDEGSRPASGFGLMSGGDDPTKAPEQHEGAREQFDFGQSSVESDLRLTVDATLRRAGGPEPFAHWEDVEGSLIRRSDGVHSAVNPWQAVYEAIADRLAAQISAAIARTPAHAS